MIEIAYSREKDKLKAMPQEIQEREIDSIKLKINHNLVEYIANQDGVILVGAPPIFALKFHLKM